MASIPDIGKDLWKSMMDQASNIYKGNINPWELPQFKQMMPQLMQEFEKMNKNTYQGAVNKGIEGGSLGAVMGNAQEGQNDAVSKMMQQIFQGGVGQGTDAWKNWLSYKLPMSQLEFNREALDKEMEAKKMEMISSNIMQGIGMLAGGISGGLSGGGIKTGGTTGGFSPELATVEGLGGGMNWQDMMKKVFTGMGYGSWGN